ncbi:MAG: 4-hydroxybenzoate-CoA ligase [Methylobacteriaceae bacterium]|nr:4-hydroxybenzoate-CoA ligase [Methylobacteriaceae bacterium]
MSSQTYNAITDLLDRNIDEGRGDKVAFIDRKRQVTYKQLQAESCRVAHLLKKLGIRQEQRVALIMLDTVDYPAVFLGAMRAGIVPVLLNTLLPAEQYAYVLKDCRARALFVSPQLLSIVEPILPRLSDLEHVIVAGDAPGGTSFKRLQESLDSLPQQFDAAETHPDEPAFWLYSSGSTGMPKGVKHVHTSLMETAKLYGQGVLGMREDDVVFSAAKLFFAYGLGNSLTFPMSVGATAVLLDERPTPGKIFEVMHRDQPTMFFGAATGYAGMLVDPACAPEKGSQRLRLCISAGEALPEHVGLKWKERYGVDILDGIGSTEMLHIYVSNAPGDVKYGTTGRAVPGYEVRLVDEDGGDVRDGEIGEMVLRGPSAAEGYWNQREKSRNTFQGQWMRTGDKFMRDSEGRYTYCGRSDDMFKVSGIWVSPFEVENALVSHPSVLEAAVIPAADGDGLLKPKAFIVLKGAEATSALDDDLKEHVKRSIGPWKYPRWIEVVDELPKTATGKIQRFKLREISNVA